jgi:hypothetical protein
MGFSIDWSNIALWGLVGTWVLVVGTLLLMWWQTRSDRHLNSANAILQMRDRFDSREMRRARAQFATWLLDPKGDYPQLEVPRMFEMLGTLTRERVLEERMVWSGFGGYVSAYYTRLRQPVDYISQWRVSWRDPLIFGQFEWLYHRIQRIDRRVYDGTSGPPLPPLEEANRILQGEVRSHESVV